MANDKILLYAALCSLLLSSCAAKTDRGPQITLLDFKTQNVERLHSGIERLVGEDSAGDAAMEYVRNYEDDLVKYYPIKEESIAPAEPDLHPNELALIYRIEETSKLPQKIPINPDPQTRRFLDFLKTQRMTAMTELRRNHDEFVATGSPAAARMGLVTAYVATTAAPSPNDLDLIVELVDPMLKALTPR